MSAEAKLIAAIVLTLLIAVIATLGMQHYMALQAKAATADQRGSVLTATSGIIAEDDKTEAQRVQVDIGVADARGTYHEQLNQAKQNEPTVADRDARLVPGSLRALARQRRLARERLGRADVGGEAQAAAADAAER